MSLVDPLNAGAVWREHVKHESGHALAAILLDFTFDDVYMDRYADYGHWGMLRGLRREPITSEVRVSDDVVASFEQFEYASYRDALDRSIVARLGCMATIAQRWDGGGATGDRENVESNRPSEYSPEAWDFIVENAASRLLRREDFRFKHADIAGALEREGRLTYEQVAGLVAGSVCDEVAEPITVG